MASHLISLFIFLPILGSILQAILPQGRVISLGTSILASVCGVLSVLSMSSQSGDLQNIELLSWIASYKIQYFVGLDGLNALSVILVALVFPVLIACEWNRKPAGNGFWGLLLLLQGSLSGAICAQDLVLVFFFWSLSAIPTYFLLGIWGGPNRERAASRYVVTTALSHALFLGAVFLIFYALETPTLSLVELSKSGLQSRSVILFGQTLSVARVSFIMIALSLSLRIPIWPIHGWLTDLVDEAPASVSVSTAAVGTAVGCYLFTRLSFLLFPGVFTDSATLMVAIGVSNLVLGCILALGQSDFGRLLTYLSLVEVGLVLVGLGSLTKDSSVGAVYQQFSLGIGLAGFGLMSGFLFSRAGQTRFTGADGKPVLGGMALKTPVVAIVSGLILASVLGVPGLTGFVAHSLLLVGSYGAFPWAVLISTAVLWVLTYTLFNFYKNVFLGAAGAVTERAEDMSWREKAYFLPIVAAAIIFGIYPGPLVELIRPTLLGILAGMK